MTERAIRMKRTARLTGGRVTLVVVALLAATVFAAPATSAQATIPSGMLSLYREAARSCPGLPWQVLAGIGYVESRHGLNGGTSSAGAIGPMQFMPATWLAFGQDASGDGVRDAFDPADAVFGTAAMLCSMGGGDPARLRAAVALYDPKAPWYAGEVLRMAASYGFGRPSGGGVPVSKSGGVLPGGRVVLSPQAAGDVASGLADLQLVRLLQLIGQRHSIFVSVLETGHGRLVDGTTRVSLHAEGRAADVFVVDGKPVGPGNDAARDLVAWLSGLEPTFRPEEVGSPFSDLRGPGLFSDDAHRDHIHIGVMPGRSAFVSTRSASPTAVRVSVPRGGPPWTCTPSSCTGTVDDRAVAWTCSSVGCAGTFGNQRVAWVCGGSGCSGMLGSQPVWWTCRGGLCAGSLSGTPISWACTPSGCSAGAPAELAVVQARPEGDPWPGLTRPDPTS